MAIKPGTNLFAFALYMVTVGVFKQDSNIPPEWRANLRQPFTAYAVSSFFYTAAGLLTLCQIAWCPLAAPPGWPTRYATIEAVLICLQGIWSYWSDVVSIGTAAWSKRPSWLRRGWPPLRRSHRKAPSALQVLGGESHRRSEPVKGGGTVRSGQPLPFHRQPL